jgi:predicted nucleotidyltransferase
MSTPKKMNSSIKILKLFLDNKDRKFTIKQVADSLKINYRIAYEQITKLNNEKLIKITRVGNSKLCELTYLFDNQLFEAEFERRKFLLKNKDFLIIYNHLNEVRTSYVALLFGSQSKGTANKYSDIDILIIGGNEKEIKPVISILPDKIHLTFLTSEEFIHMYKSKEFTIVSEAVKNNHILIGIEEYYRLIKNAGLN